ncbi:MAG TPA: flagellar motor protein [Casimicrobiaceae bacterium]|nr:flagellar motor protein [Casimicrobiaceae bacterium]
MDILSLTGLAVAALAIVGGQWLEGGHLASLAQFAAFTIVVGGTLAAVMVQSPWPTFVEGMRLARWLFVPPPIESARVIETITTWADRARKDGMLALENELASVNDAFVRNGLQMLVDGFDPEKISEAMHVEISGYEERYRAAARVWEAAGGYAPTIGILGAVLGLIHVMENLSDPNKLGGGIAVAFVATVYGVGSANLVFLPMANKLKAIIKRQVQERELIVDGLLGIANGENPKLIESRLAGYFR